MERIIPEKSLHRFVSLRETISNKTFYRQIIIIFNLSKTFLFSSGSNRVNHPYFKKTKYVSSIFQRPILFLISLSFLRVTARLPRDVARHQRIWRLTVGTRHQYININTWQNRYINVGQRCRVSYHPCITGRWNSSAST